MLFSPPKPNIIVIPALPPTTKLLISFACFFEGLLLLIMLIKLGHITANIISIRIRNGAEAYTDVDDTTKNEIERTGRTRRRRAWMCEERVLVLAEKTMNVGKNLYSF